MSQSTLKPTTSTDFIYVCVSKYEIGDSFTLCDLRNFEELFYIPQSHTLVEGDPSLSFVLKIDSTHPQYLDVYLLYGGTYNSSKDLPYVYKACKSSAEVIQTQKIYVPHGSILKANLTLKKKEQKHPNAFFRILVIGPQSKKVTAPITVKKRVNEGLGCGLLAIAIQLACKNLDKTLLISRMQQEKDHLISTFTQGTSGNNQLDIQPLDPSAVSNNLEFKPNDTGKISCEMEVWTQIGSKAIEDDLDQAQLPSSAQQEDCPMRVDCEAKPVYSDQEVCGTDNDGEAVDHFWLETNFEAPSQPLQRPYVDHYHPTFTLSQPASGPVDVSDIRITPNY